MVELGLVDSPLEGVETFGLGPLVLHLEDLPDLAPYGPGDVVHILRLDGRLDVVLKDLGEVVLELASAEVQ